MWNDVLRRLAVMLLLVVVLGVLLVCTQVAGDGREAAPPAEVALLQVIAAV